MPFVGEILKHRSLSIVGLDKNTGKTVCLNYILRRLDEQGVPVGVTSIGVDGEQVDSVFATAKPEITLYEGSRFITSEQHYLKRQLVSVIERVDSRRTALGPLVTARVLLRGKALLSGAATTGVLRGQIDELCSAGCRLAIVDGALSRLSLASPTVTDAMVLATGAAVSASVGQLVNRTRFVHNLIMLGEVEPGLRRSLAPLDGGLWGIDDDGLPHDLGVRSAFLIKPTDKDLLRFGKRVFASGAVSDRLLRSLAVLAEGVTLVARDFTKLFVTPEAYADFTRRGGQVQVLQRSRLLAVTLNPTSPQGFLMDSERTCAALSEALQTPVYDVMRIGR
ncbi:MAG: hypothetical protein IJ760_06280 [Bacteroidales bacterium]|nr:hypothetical protein [Bacteroidales bacterium]